MDDVERTLPASERRRAWAREQGYSPRSAAFTACVSLGTAAGLWLSAAPTVIDQLASRLRERLSSPSAVQLTIDSATDVIRDDFVSFGAFAVWALAAVWSAAAVANVLQTGPQWSPSACALDTTRLDPVQSLTRLLSVDSLVNWLWSLAALVAAGVACGIALSSGFVAGPFSEPLPATVRRASDQFAVTALQLAGLLLAVCLADVASRRWRYERSLMMTPAEQKEEAGRTPAKRRR